MNELLHVGGQAEAEAAIAAERDARNRELLGTSPDAKPAVVVGKLEAFIDKVFTRNRDHRNNSGIDAGLLASLRAVNSEYSPEKLAEITAAGGSDIYMGLTGVKYRAAVAWLSDIFATEDDKTWGLKPSPVPDLPPSDIEEISAQVQANVQQFMQQMAQPQEGADPSSPPPELSPEVAARFRDKLVDDVRDMIMKKAVEKAEGMELLIHDQLVEGGWLDAFSGFLCDVVGSKAGIIKGPITRMRRRKKWITNPQTGQAEIIVTQEPVKTFERVSPFDAFPAPTAVDFSDDFIERYRLTRASLVDLQTVDGYNALEIMAVLSEFDALAAPANTQATDIDRAELEKKKSTEADSVRDSIEALEAWISVPGAELIDFGWTADEHGQPIDPVLAYDICAIKVGNHIILAEFNPDPIHRKPYCKYGWGYIAGSFWYQSLPELMAQLQNMINAANRSLVNNMSISAGVQIQLNDISRLCPGEDITSAFPGKVWQFTNKNNSTLPPLQFFQPNSNARELLDISDKATQLADDYTGVPAYNYGTPSASAAGRTSSGLSMLMSNAAKGIKRIILGIDRFVFRPLIERCYDANMLDPNVDPAIKGDMIVETVGAVALMVKEQLSEQRMAFLAATANPMDFKIMGYSGRAKMLEAASKSLELAGDKVVQDDVEIEKNVVAEQDAQNAQVQQEFALKQAQLQADVEFKRGQIEVQKADLALKAQELAQVKTPQVAVKAQEAQNRAQNDALRGYLEVTKQDEQKTKQEA
jgi:hypothetical protein